MYTYNDWLQPNLHLRLEDRNRDFEVLFQPYQFKNKSFEEECDITAQMIATKAENIFIGLSGGIDSEFVCKVFLRNFVKFTPIIAVYEGNEKERAFAFDFCQRHSINPIILEITNYELIKILFEDIFKKLNGVGINSIATIAAGRHAEKNNGIYIQAEHLVGDGTEKINAFDYYIPEWDFYNHVLTQTEIIPFFIYRLELCYAMLDTVCESYDTWVNYKSKMFQCMIRPKLKPKYNSDIMKLISLVYAQKKILPKHQYIIGTLPVTKSKLLCNT
jgi:hypothetical protein